MWEMRSRNCFSGSVFSKFSWFQYLFSADLKFDIETMPYVMSICIDTVDSHGLRYHPVVTFIPHFQAQPKQCMKCHAG